MFSKIDFEGGSFGRDEVGVGEDLEMNRIGVHAVKFTKVQ